MPQPSKVTDRVNTPVLVSINQDGTLTWESPDSSQNKPKHKNVTGPIQMTAEPASAPTVMTVETVGGSVALKGPRGGIIAISLNEGEC